MERLVLQRVGPDIFRRELLNFWSGPCCISGLNIPYLLRASHSRPWAKCATDKERLDVYNGLLPAPHLDMLYDGGWIAVENNGEVKLSESLSMDARTRLNFCEPMQVDGLHAKHYSYLDYHRDLIFRR
ncbi:HNH endonuclease signature motif containing protein [Glaciimonas sp. CA11.2]|uniref:HNH endonuclease n=1 Tax=Glaciimonas sp. CA11.2 TaxID=3048601 RepID=UPI002AB3D71E|nr:HNH endonuclease signature motif containing protein [Glaciimonas sp. CA11.2]MDY7546744.1 HNH endonuclease signature motif containing protein [Glaciimonas sp. CA11.2]